MRKLLNILLPVICLAGSLTATGQDKTVVLFDEDTPVAVDYAHPDQGTLTVYQPAQVLRNGTGVVFCPGGGYSMLSFNQERQNVLEWLLSKGVTVFLLRYRHGGNGHHYPAPVQDVQRAIRWARHQAKSYGLQPDKIGVMGFSAGGHLAALAATRFDSGPAAPDDALQKTSARPDFAVLFYPVINLSDPALAHAGSRKNLVGPGADSVRLAATLSAETYIHPQTPPVFVLYGGGDQTTPPGNGAVFFQALRKAGIPVELHAFERGPHGFGLPVQEPNLRLWPLLLENWLTLRNFL